MISTFLLYFNSLRYLKKGQILWRVALFLPKRRLRLPKVPALRRVGKKLKDDIVKPNCLSLPEHFKFLNEEGQLSAIGWQGDEKSALWRYNQHYFDWLGAAAARAEPLSFLGITEDWMQRSPQRMGVGWDPYPTSLRIVNWVKLQLRSDILSTNMLASLALQAQHLSRSVEWHLMANHLFANGKALVFAGCLFDGPIAAKWLTQGVRILDAQLDEQILADGGHFELSPMYHAIILEDCLDLLNLLEAADLPQTTALAGKLRARLPDMLRWLDAMCLPDGEISFFNDATFDIAARPADLRAYAARLGVEVPVVSFGMLHLPESGYVRHSGDRHVALMDVGEVGAAYQPGHAHADTLSFELAVFGKRLLVNAGISCYGVSDERLRQRGTAAHNAVTVDGANSSQVWSGFRVARRAKPLDLQVDAENNLVSCRHDGYFRLQGRPAHRRMWRFGTDCMEIEDGIDGAHGSAEAWFHLHPDWAVAVDGTHFVCTQGKGRVTLSFGDAQAEPMPSAYFPGFNLRRDTTVLRVPLRNGRLLTSVSW